jgi:formamidopyrimidine-DNA glycosylase
VPELPEVETIVRDLRPQLLGRTITTVWTSGLALRRPIDATVARAVGGEVQAVRRLGKYLIVEIGGSGDSGDAAAPVALLGHLGMTGRLTVTPVATPRPPHTHLCLGLSGGAAALELRYTDARRFGLWRCYPGAELAASAELAELGPDPLDGPGLDGPALRARLGGTRRALKVALLDQSVVAGLGNIYVCEALFAARVSPLRAGGTLSAPRAVRLAGAIREVLARGVQNRGTSFSDYVDGNGNRGGNQTALAVFQREGLPCPACQSPIRRVVQAARSTFYCPRCQRQ